MATVALGVMVQMVLPVVIVPSAAPRLRCIPRMAADAVVSAPVRRWQVVEVQAVVFPVQAVTPRDQRLAQRAPMGVLAVPRLMLPTILVLAAAEGLDAILAATRPAQVAMRS